MFGLLPDVYLSIATKQKGLLCYGCRCVSVVIFAVCLLIHGHNIDITLVNGSLVPSMEKCFEYGLSRLPE